MEEHIHMIEIELSERRMAADSEKKTDLKKTDNLEKTEPFEAAPAEYTYREGDAPDALSGEIPNETGDGIGGQDGDQVTGKQSLLFPIIAVVGGIGVGVFLLAGGGSQSDISVPTVAPLSESGEVFSVDFGKAGTYVSYSPESKITYSAGTNLPAQTVSWYVCDQGGNFIKTIGLEMQSNIDDPVLRSKRWKSTGASAFPEGRYNVTVRAESLKGETAKLSFVFDPKNTIETKEIPPECGASL
jgi:hypothetical protein